MAGAPKTMNPYRMHIMLCRFFRVALLAVFLWTGTGGDRLWASHILGGEITYKCLGNGLFEFTV